MPTKRELIEPHKGDKRYARRSPEGQFTPQQADVGRSLAADKKKHAKKTVPKGKGIEAIKRVKPWRDACAEQQLMDMVTAVSVRLRNQTGCVPSATARCQKKRRNCSKTRRNGRCISNRV